MFHLDLCIPRWVIIFVQLENIPQLPCVTVVNAKVIYEYLQLEIETGRETRKWTLDTTGKWYFVVPEFITFVLSERKVLARQWMNLSVLLPKLYLSVSCRLWSSVCSLMLALTQPANLYSNQHNSLLFWEHRTQDFRRIPWGLNCASPRCLWFWVVLCQS